jgi:hypothetical protein
MGLLRLRSPSLATRAPTLAERILLAASIVIVALSGAERAHAQASAGAPYDRALSAYLEADFELSRASAEEALDDAATTLADVARAHLLLALLAHVERADRTVVDAEIAAAVALDAAVVAPEGSPRAFTERLEAARAAARETPRTLVLERETHGGVQASLVGVPAHLVDRLTLRCGTATATTSAGTLVVSLPRASGSCEAAALDARGRVLVSATQGVGDAGADPRAGQRDSMEAEPRDDTPFLVLGVVGAVLVVGGAITLGVVLASPSGDSVLAAPRIPEWSR